MKLKGTIRRSDLEGGHWVLETDGGERYQLAGSLGRCKDGLVAEVEGKVEKDMMGIGMTGPTLTVQKTNTRNRPLGGNGRRPVNASPASCTTTSSETRSATVAVRA